MGVGGCNSRDPLSRPIKGADPDILKGGSMFEPFLPKSGG